jgi:hypothetical protein
MRLRRQSGNQTITALADEQIEQWANDRQEPDNQQPEYFLAAGEIIPQDDDGQNDVTDDGYEDDDKHKQDSPNRTNTAIST